MNNLKSLTKNDRLFFLGDFGELSDEEAKQFKNLKVLKIMIMGNHDKESREYYMERYGFSEVYYTSYWYSKRILLSHEPMLVDKGIINIHGHLHNSYLSLKNYLNVNVFLTEYKPIHLKLIMNLLSGLEKPARVVFLKEWYAPHYRYLSQRPDLVLNEDMSVDFEASEKLRNCLKLTR